MKRMIRLMAMGGYIDQIQCPNPDCAEILDIPETADPRDRGRKKVFSCLGCNEEVVFMTLGPIRMDPDSKAKKSIAKFAKQEKEKLK